MPMRKGKHNAGVMQEFLEDIQHKSVRILNRKNIFDKGSKIKRNRDTHQVFDVEEYNIKLW